MVAVTGACFAGVIGSCDLSVLDQDALLYLLVAASPWARSPWRPGRRLPPAGQQYAVGPYVSRRSWLGSRPRRRARRPWWRRAGRRYPCDAACRWASHQQPYSCRSASRWSARGDEARCACPERGDRHRGLRGASGQHRNCYLSQPEVIGTSVTSQSEDSFFPYSARA